MNRRNFFKTVTGFVAGVFALVVPKAVGSKRSGTKFIYNTRCNCPEQRLIQNGDRVIVVCPNHEPYFLYPDDEIAEIYSYRTGEKISSPEATGGWKFYINNKEIDSSRAVNENGCLHWPFQGSEIGDLCEVKSPSLDCYIGRVKDTKVRMGRKKLNGLEV